jgi:DNA-binding MarR family transcriptional regulator
MSHRRSPVPTEARDTTGFLIYLAGVRAMALTDIALTPVKLNIKGYTLLWTLDMVGPSSQQTLADIIKVGRNAMVQLVDQLSRQGCVKRHQNPDNRRENIVTITEMGKRSLRKAADLMKSVRSDLTSNLSEDEKVLLNNLLLKVIE